MADRRVHRTEKDNDGDIQGLCSNESWGYRTRRGAVDDIKTGRHSYYVKDRYGTRADVHIYAGFYLRTDPNSTCVDNLDTLPNC